MNRQKYNRKNISLDGPLFLKIKRNRLKRDKLLEDQNMTQLNYINLIEY